MSAVGDDAVELARELIRVDTTNPPGAETPAAELLASYLREAGAEVELAGPDPERLNVIARIVGGDGPSLMLMGHTDVVPAPREGWSVNPFAAEVRDGRLMGRGATDMKDEVAARAAAFAAIARAGERPAGDLVFVGESDEEKNVSDVGMSWLARERPDLRCDFAINEGGGVLYELADGRRVITISVGEKQVTAARVRVFGTAGHASVPEGADNPLRHAAAVIERLLAHGAEPRVVPAVARALDSLGAPDPGDDEGLLAWAREQHRMLGEAVPAMTRLTVTPTGTRTYEPANVIPPYADVICDCRALPGQSEADIRAHVAAALGDQIPYELELLEPLAGGTESEIGTPLYEAIASWADERVPGATLLPLISTGFTDSHWVREAWGTVAYGFAPVIHGDPMAYLDAAHADDESIALADIEEMAEFHLRAARSLLYP